MERICQYISPEPNSGCWLWFGTEDGHEYGSVWFSGRPHKAHRVFWTLTFGEIPRGLFVLHKCDTPACCNPDHLFLGTHKENMIDMVSKGRQQRGTKHPKSILTDGKVLEIRKRYRKYKHGSTSGLAREFGVSKSMISFIVLHK